MPTWQRWNVHQILEDCGIEYNRILLVDAEKEAKRIRFLLKIAAPPMEDIFTLPSVYREYDEESDEETWSDEEPVKDPYYVGSNKSEDWYKSEEE